MRLYARILEIGTQPGIGVHNITPYLQQHLTESRVKQGLLSVSSRHTTTALTINEQEERLIDDIKAFLAELVPKDKRYLS